MTIVLLVGVPENRCGGQRMSVGFPRSPELAYASLRFGIGRFNTIEEIDRVSAAVVETVRSLR